MTAGRLPGKVVGMGKFIRFAVVLACAVSLAGCGSSIPWPAVNSVSLQACEIVFVALDPSLGDALCTTTVEIAQALEDLFGVDDDAGTTPGVHEAMSNVQVNAAVYQWLVAHGAKPVKH